MKDDATLKSPDGRYEAIQRHFDEIRMGSPQFAQLEIRGSIFGVVPGLFAEPVAFSPDSRFLATAEFAGTSDPCGRVVVFDFERQRRIMVYAFTGFARAFAWQPDGALVLTWWRHLHGEQSLGVWRPPIPRKKHWWERLFHAT